MRMNRIDERFAKVKADGSERKGYIHNAGGGR